MTKKFKITIEKDDKKIIDRYYHVDYLNNALKLLLHDIDEENLG